MNLHNDADADAAVDADSDSESDASLLSDRVLHFLRTALIWCAPLCQCQHHHRTMHRNAKKKNSKKKNKKHTIDSSMSLTELMNVFLTQQLAKRSNWSHCQLNVLTQGFSKHRICYQNACVLRENSQLSLGRTNLCLNFAVSSIEFMTLHQLIGDSGIMDIWRNHTLLVSPYRPDLALQCKGTHCTSEMHNAYCYNLRDIVTVI